MALLFNIPCYLLTAQYVESTAFSSLVKSCLVGIPCFGTRTLLPGSRCIESPEASVPAVLGGEVRAVYPAAVVARNTVEQSSVSSSRATGQLANGSTTFQNLTIGCCWQSSLNRLLI